MVEGRRGRVVEGGRGRVVNGGRGRVVKEWVDGLFFRHPASRLWFWSRT